ncbi:MAG: DUF6222 family protein [Actinophytocola sp.]|uniref:hypothetical protein n=1 Tax=Actinophytocola sp. TaxID=1872138 RepID=UPI003C77497E
MPQFDGLPRERTATNDEENPVARLSVVEELHPTTHTNLARGIVWADVLADIAADEEARRQLRDAA